MKNELMTFNLAYELDKVKSFYKLHVLYRRPSVKILECMVFGSTMDIIG